MFHVEQYRGTGVDTTFYDGSLLGTPALSGRIITLRRETLGFVKGKV
jgi:hypothetical protein